MVKSRQFLRNLTTIDGLTSRQADSVLVDSLDTKPDMTDRTSPRADRSSSTDSRTSLEQNNNTTGRLSENNNNNNNNAVMNCNIEKKVLGTSSSPPIPSLSHQSLPPSCGAKQLSKLKRFLTTLQQFGSDISTEIGDKVRSLVLALLNSQISVEEFHTRLHDTTNFPLKPFVIPFLKATLPSLQRELQHCAQLLRMTPQQYLNTQQHSIFDMSTLNSSHSPINLSEKRPVSPANTTNRKRNSNSESEELMEPPPTKRTPSISSPLSSPIDLFSPTHIQLDDISKKSTHRLEAVDLSYLGARKPALISTEKIVEEYKNIDSMLTTIVNMVNKSRQVITGYKDQQLIQNKEYNTWYEQTSGHNSERENKFNSEMLTQTLKQSEDRVNEIRIKAEEVVNQVKRQAITELHKAVTAAELRANELITQERNKLEKTLQSIKQTTKQELVEELNQQTESPENCWNCGRKANETCSGCNQARYCGQFCQHKDWDRHHKNCGSAISVKSKTGSTPDDSDPRKSNTQTTKPSSDTQGEKTP